MADLILLYRNEEQDALSDININSILINGDLLQEYSLYRVADNFNFYTYNALYDLPFSVNDINELGLTQNVALNKLTIIKNGVYKIDLCISTTLASDGLCYFRLFENANKKTDMVCKNGFASITLTLQADDELKIEVEQAQASDLVTLNSYLCITRIR